MPSANSAVSSKIMFHGRKRHVLFSWSQVRGNGLDAFLDDGSLSPSLERAVASYMYENDLNSGGVVYVERLTYQNPIEVVVAVVPSCSPYCALYVTGRNDVASTAPAPVTTKIR